MNTCQNAPTTKTPPTETPHFLPNRPHLFPKEIKKIVKPPPYILFNFCDSNVLIKCLPAFQFCWDVFFCT